MTMEQVSQLQYIHEHNYVHGDIKPQNVLMGLDDMASVPFVIDFGIALQYLDAETRRHHPFQRTHRLTGTPAFASINSHLGAGLTRRDDIESLIYTLIYCLYGSLPWLKDTSRLKNSSILKMKQFPAETLCQGLPCNFAMMLNYARTLSFSDTPEYDHLRSLLQSINSKIYPTTVNALAAGQSVLPSPKTPPALICEPTGSPIAHATRARCGMRKNRDRGTLVR